MTRLILKNKDFKIIGFIDIEYNGNKVLKDKNYKIIGFYDKKTNQTKTKDFLLVGHGDLLTTLI